MIDKNQLPNNSFESDVNWFSNLINKLKTSFGGGNKIAPKTEIEYYHKYVYPCRLEDKLNAVMEAKEQGKDSQTASNT